VSEVVSVRLPDEVARRLRDEAAGTTEAVSGLAARLVDEGLRMATHPGIVFRSGPSGRRAALITGPDVWEIIGLIRSLDARGVAALAEAADWLGLTEPQIRTALGYYGAFPDEIDARIAANDSAAEQAERSWRTQQELLG
jgi:hypothetical protein